MKMREYLVENDFVDVETPTLFRRTPGVSGCDVEIQASSGGEYTQNFISGLIFFWMVLVYLTFYFMKFHTVLETVLLREHKSLLCLPRFLVTFTVWCRVPSSSSNY